MSTVIPLKGSASEAYQYVLEFVYRHWPSAVSVCIREDEEDGPDVYAKGDRVRGCSRLRVFKNEDDYLLSTLFAGACPQVMALLREDSLELSFEGEEGEKIVNAFVAHPLWRGR